MTILSKGLGFRPLKKSFLSYFFGMEFWQHDYPCGRLPCCWRWVCGVWKVLHFWPHGRKCVHVVSQRRTFQMAQRWIILRGRNIEYLKKTEKFWAKVWRAWVFFGQSIFARSLTIVSYSYFLNISLAEQIWHLNRFQFDPKESGL